MGIVSSSSLRIVLMVVASLLLMMTSVASLVILLMVWPFLLVSFHANWLIVALRAVGIVRSFSGVLAVSVVLTFAKVRFALFFQRSFLRFLVLVVPVIWNALTSSNCRASISSLELSLV